MALSDSIIRRRFFEIVKYETHDLAAYNTSTALKALDASAVDKYLKDLWRISVGA